MSLAQSIKSRNINNDCVIKNAYEVLGFLPNGAPKLVKVWKCSCGMNASILPSNITLSNGIPIEFDSSDEEEEIEPCKCCLARIYKRKGLKDVNNVSCQTCLNWNGVNPCEIAH